MKKSLFENYQDNNCNNANKSKLSSNCGKNNVDYGCYKYIVGAIGQPGPTGPTGPTGVTCPTGHQEQAL